MTTAKKSTRGGARKGAGRKAVDSTGPVERKTVTLDVKTIQTMRNLGEGDLSRGIRRAAQIIRESGF